MVERRRLGLSYNCDEQFVRGHQCKRLFNLLITDDPEDGATDAEAKAALHAALMAEQPTQEGQATPTKETPRMSLYVIADIRTRDTIVIPVFVNGQHLEALVDTGSSHTFVDTAVAQCIKLESEPTNLRVAVANGDKVPCAAVE
jgi:predicted aspartyl protease